MDGMEKRLETVEWRGVLAQVWKRHLGGWEDSWFRGKSYRRKRKKSWKKVYERVKGKTKRKRLNINVQKEKSWMLWSVSGGFQDWLGLLKVMKEWWVTVTAEKGMERWERLGGSWNKPRGILEVLRNSLKLFFFFGPQNRTLNKIRSWWFLISWIWNYSLL